MTRERHPNDIHYGFEHGGFKDDTGNAVTRDDFGRLAATDGARKALAGGSALARVAYLNSVVREAGRGERDGVLAHLSRFADQQQLDRAPNALRYLRFGAEPCQCFAENSRY